jgi:hypothetical protein
MGRIIKVFELAADYIRRVSGNRITLPLLLLLQFSLHLFFYYNTESFRNISEAGALLGALDRIRAGERPLPLYGFYWYMTPAYVAFFLEKVSGTPDAYFVFQCLLSVLTTLIVYRIVLLVSGSGAKGIFAVLLLISYFEFTLLSSVFYNQVYEILFSSLFLWLTILLYRASSFKTSLLYITLIVITVLLSLLFRSTLIYSFSCFIVAGIAMVIFRGYRPAIRFWLTGIILFFFVLVVNPWSGLREGDFKPESTISFWGHTMYGGNGGEVGFIYKENEELFNKKLKEFARERGYNTIDESVILLFKEHEVRRFITEEPHKWILLQIRKVLYTFGAVPQRDALTMLVTGKIKMSWIAASGILQFSFALIIILFLLTADLRIKDLFEPAGNKFFIYLFSVYLLGAICFYSAYSERYRIVSIVATFVPVITINSRRLLEISNYRNRIRISLLVFILAVWAYQIYEALVIHSDRYFKALGIMK